jgi:hypothetical protein
MHPILAQRYKTEGGAIENPHVHGHRGTHGQVPAVRPPCCLSLLCQQSRAWTAPLQAVPGATGACAVAERQAKASVSTAHAHTPHGEKAHRREVARMDRRWRCTCPAEPLPVAVLAERPGSGQYDIGSAGSTATAEFARQCHIGDTQGG